MLKEIKGEDFKKKLKQKEITIGVGLAVIVSILLIIFKYEPSNLVKTLITTTTNQICILFKEF